MFGEDSEEAQGAFHNVFAEFSEKEWKLLQDWEKKLYRNVMKEIHRALISLGPLISTTVYSLISKEKEALIPVTNQDTERKPSFNHSPNDVMTNPDVSFQINREEHPYLKTPQDSDRKEEHDCFDTGMSFFNTDICLRKEEEPIPILIDHLGIEVGESSADPEAAGRAVVSFCIKSEEEPYCSNRQDSNRIGSIHCATGDGSRRRKWKGTYITKCAEKIPIHKDVVLKANVNALHSSEKGSNTTSQLWSEKRQKKSGKNKIQCEKEFVNRMHSSLQGENLKTEGSDTNNECDNGAWNATLVTCSQNTPQNWTPFISTESGQNLSYNEVLFDNRKSAIIQRPYKCTECNKSFSRKHHFIGHQRIHTGERPYHCTECEKSFSHTHHLARHQKLHVGEKPYQCIECGKQFSRKDSLMGHQKVHGGEKPYECTTCFKRFRQKQNLIGHLRTHMGQIPNLCKFQLQEQYNWTPDSPI